MAKKKGSVYWYFTDDEQSIVRVSEWNGFDTAERASFPYTTITERDQNVLLAEDFLDDLNNGWTGGEQEVKQ